MSDEDVTIGTGAPHDGTAEPHDGTAEPTDTTAGPTGTTAGPTPDVVAPAGPAPGPTAGPAPDAGGGPAPDLPADRTIALEAIDEPVTVAGPDVADGTARTDGGDGADDDAEAVQPGGRRGRHASTRRSRRKAQVVKPRHFPCFDGLRAIAAITVVGVHTAFISGTTTSSKYGIYTARLEIGVTVFFLISGFLLYRPFAASHIAGRAAPGVGRFWVRRFLRIVPAYWLAFTVVSYVMHGDVHLLHGWNNDLIYYGFAQIYFPHVVLTGVSQAWSLNTEVTFYLFLPLYAAVVGFRRKSDGRQLARELLGVAVLIGISFSFRTWEFHQHTLEQHVMAIWLPAWLDMFGLGMLLAVLSSWFAHREAKPKLLWNPFMPWISWGLALGAFWGVSHLGIPVVPIYTDHLSINMARQSLYGAFAFFLLLPAVFGPQPRGLIRRFLACKPMVGLGVVSYGIYLWHQGWILVYLRWTHRNLNFPFGLPYWELFLAVLGLATATATASYLLFERPILKLKDRVGWWSRRDQPPRLLASSGPVTAAPATGGGP